MTGVELIPLLKISAVGEIAPPGSRGSLPSVVYQMVPGEFVQIFGVLAQSLFVSLDGDL